MNGFEMVLFFLFFFFKQFYVFSSGNAGVADICLIGCFIVILLRGRREHRILRCVKEDILLYIFVFLVVLINGYYGVRERSTEYLKYSIYWIYNGCAVFTFRMMAGCCGKKFFDFMNLAVKGNILVQIAVYLTGHGRIFREAWGATRYMGTFNDPNQMAFFVFMMLLLGYLYMAKFGDRTYPVFYVLGLWLILATKSTGILLGMLVFSGCVAFCLLRRVYRSGRWPKKVWIVLGIAAAVFLVAACVILWPPADFDVKEVDYNMVTRIQEKIWKVAHGGLLGMFLDRGAEKLVLYPGYLLLGAGEGGFDRFTLASQVNEIHSCFFSVWFCYGIIPLVILMGWLWKVLRKNRGLMWCAVLGLLAESFFLINYRQPMFWLILVFGACAGELEENAG
jgi:hypothetical protein